LVFLYVLMIPAGLLGLGWGFWAANNAKKPLDIIGSVVIIIGFIVALLGALLTAVPGFFS
jgi:hypothetical protein